MNANAPSLAFRDRLDSLARYQGRAHRKTLHGSESTAIASETTQTGVSELESVVLAVEHRLNARDFKLNYPETGGDIKVMGVRDHDDSSLTVSCALVGQFLKNINACSDAKDRLREIVLETTGTITRRNISIRVNAADDMTTGSVFLTVSGTSAEAGDDGQAGRGNRANGLITPCRSMTLEASAGKNPVTHVGKLYNAGSEPTGWHDIPDRHPQHGHHRAM